MLHRSRHPYWKKSAQKRHSQWSGDLGTLGEFDCHPTSGQLELMRGCRIRVRCNNGKPRIALLAHPCFKGQAAEQWHAVGLRHPLSAALAEYVLRMAAVRAHVHG